MQQKLILIKIVIFVVTISCASLPNKCSLPKEPGPCEAYMPKWYFDGEKCSQFVYGGCGGNDNQFNTEFECKRECRQLPKFCYLPKDPGSCENKQEKWYFNGINCTKFVYNGCEGNANNYDNEKICHNACVVAKLPDLCFLPKDRGYCIGTSVQRWYFDGEKCSKFEHTRCGGNDNRFAFKTHCMKTCNI